MTLEPVLSETTPWTVTGLAAGCDWIAARMSAMAKMLCHTRIAAVAINSGTTTSLTSLFTLRSCSGARLSHVRNAVGGEGASGLKGARGCVTVGRAIDFICDVRSRLDDGFEQLGPVREVFE